jgi:hypothetical protein
MANLRWEEGDFIRDLGFRIPEAELEMEIAGAGRTPASHFSDGNAQGRTAFGRYILRKPG